MDVIVTTNEAADLLRMNRQSIDRQLKRGCYTHARKVGGRWLINLSREYPELFGEEEPASVAADTGSREH